MISDVILFILFLLGFVLLAYTVIVLFKRKEYENKRIFSGYNVLILGIIFLALSSLGKTIKMGILAFNEEVVLDSLLYFDVITNLILIPLFGISFLVGMLLFREI